jgi:hypothetical protein
MDSSRSGLLSTILMTLPLIVVPAFALLRPPGQAGVSMSGLEASEDGSKFQDSFFDNPDGFDADSSGVFKTEQSGKTETERDGHQHFEDESYESSPKPEDDILDELESFAPQVQRTSPKHSSPPRRTQVDPFMDTSASRSLPPEQNRSQEEDSQTELLNSPESGTLRSNVGVIIEQLNALGALKTVWFEAGEKTPVGLAVFFRGSRDNTRIRFEAVGQNRGACAQNVLAQVTRWQQQNPEQ